MISENYKTAKIYDHQWLQDFFTALKAQGAEPDHIALDNEEGFTYWHIKQIDNKSPEEMEEIFKTIYERHKAQMPAYLQTFVPADFGYYWQRPNGKKAVLEYNRWALEMKNNAMRYMFESVFQDVYGNPQKFKISNYNDMDLGHSVYDHNNWEMRPNSYPKLSSVASPELYYDLGGRHRAEGQPTKYDLALQDVKDEIDSNIKGLGNASLFIPWVAVTLKISALPGEEEIFYKSQEDIIRYAHDKGVRNFLFFEPDPLNDEQKARITKLISEIQSSTNVGAQGNVDTVTHGNFALKGTQF
jgi:hypothetical protein